MIIRIIHTVTGKNRGLVRNNGLGHKARHNWLLNIDSSDVRWQIRSGAGGITGFRRLGWYSIDLVYAVR